MAYDLRRMRAMSNKVAIVGIGDTNYAEDYRRPKGDTLTQRDSYDLGVEAFLKALEDSGLRKEDIDGLGVTSPLGFERVGEILGLKYSWGAEVGGVEQLVHLATEAINSGRCNTVALLYGNAQRSLGTAYGGPSQSQSAYMVLWYFHPWGFSSNGAEYALVFREYFEKYGGTEEKLGTVAVTLRKHAMLNENAVMRTPLTINDYMNSRYIARPLHLYDYCIINDGGAALILTRADRAKHLRHTPVLVSGVGRFSDGVRHTQIPFRFMDDCWNNLQYASEQCFGMAKLGPKDIQHFQTYDGFSVLIPMNLEGFGFCKRGEGLDYIQDGRIELGGELPVNTSGGMLSEAYMHGWNHHVEAVRQLRHEAGARQVKDVQTSMYCHHGHWGAVCSLFTRGD